MEIVVIVLLVLGAIILVAKGKSLYQFLVKLWNSLRLLLQIDGMIGFLVILIALLVFFLLMVP